MCVNLMRPCNAGSRVTTLPINTSPPPLAYLVSACVTTSMPCSNPRSAMPAPQVLSSAVVMPRALAAAARPARSGNSIVTEPAASSHTSWVCGLSIAANAAVFMGS